MSFDSFQDDKYICQCCGGRINRRTMTCEYCGTQYRDAFDSVIRVETFHNPIQTLAAHVVLDRQDLMMMGDNAGEFVRSEISHKIAEALSGLMQYDFDYKLDSGKYEVRGIAKVVVPIDRGTDRFFPGIKFGE